jgi:hypothetical protein
MCSEEIFDPSRRHGEDGEGLGSVELHVLDGEGDGEFGVGGSDDGVEVLEDLLQSDLEGQVRAHYL